MANKSKPTKKRDSKEITTDRKLDEKQAVDVARMALNPTVQAAYALVAYGKPLGELDILGLVESLNEQTQATIDGDLNRGEAMLTAQAHTLDAIFNNLAKRAIKAEYMEHMDRFLKLALRAQSQCRATWDALATIKNPPMVGYVKQANIAHGPQQVNNVPSTESEAASARKNEKLQNKLLEEKDGERLDTGAKGTASKTDQEVAAVGKIDRPKVK